MPKPVTVDLLHPTVVRAFTNWGYISFFGCIAALITLLFFAIGQVKQADEARQRVPSVPQEQPIQNPIEERGEGSASSMPAVKIISTHQVESPYIYRNSILGFSFDYTPLIAAADSLVGKPLEIRLYERGADTMAMVYDPTDRSYEGSSPRPILFISESPDARSMDAYVQAEAARFIRDYGTATAKMIGVERVSYGANEVLRITSEPGLCDGETYTFFTGGYRVTLSSVCAGKQGRQAFDSVLRTLTVE